MLQILGSSAAADCGPTGATGRRSTSPIVEHLLLELTRLVTELLDDLDTYVIVCTGLNRYVEVGSDQDGRLLVSP